MTEDTFEFVLYRYTPSLPAAIIGFVVFALLTSAHVWKVWKHNTLYFIPFVAGGVFETIGYAGRAWNHYDTTSIGGYVMQSLLILLAPALFAASIYMILGRLIRALDAGHLSVVRLTWLTKLFVSGDVVSFLLQLSGGGISAAGTLATSDIGQKLIVAGLFAQIAFFGFFLATAIVFHSRARKSTELRSDIIIPWQRHMIVLYVGSVLILIRSIFRVVEYLQGNAGYLISHEVFTYFFDMLLMAATMAVLLVWYVADITTFQPAKDDEASQSVCLTDLEHS